MFVSVQPNARHHACVFARRVDGIVMHFMPHNARVKGARVSRVACSNLLGLLQVKQ